MAIASVLPLVSQVSQDFIPLHILCI